MMATRVRLEVTFDMQPPSHWKKLRSTRMNNKHVNKVKLDHTNQRPASLCSFGAGALVRWQWSWSVLRFEINARTIKVHRCLSQAYALTHSAARPIPLHMKKGRMALRPGRCIREYSPRVRCLLPARIEVTLQRFPQSEGWMIDYRKPKSYRVV